MKITFAEVPSKTYGGPRVLAVYGDGRYYGTIIKYGQDWLLGHKAIFPSIVHGRKEAAESLIWQRHNVAA